METNNAISKDMMQKLKESFSLKSFSSSSYHSSLICNSKTIRIDMNLIGGKVLNSGITISGKNFPARSSGNVTGTIQRVSRWPERHLGSLEVKNKSASLSSVVLNSPGCENNKQLLEMHFTEDGKLKPKTTVKHLYQVKNHNSLNQIPSKANSNCSEFKPFRCDICMKYFPNEKSFKRHNKLHSEERYSCETCGEIFLTKKSLKKHCMATHEVKMNALKCSKCYKAYSKKAYLNKHLKTCPDQVQQSSLEKSSSSTDLLLDQNGKKDFMQ